MSSNTPLILEGKYFTIITKFKSNKLPPKSISIDSSDLIRGKINSSNSPLLKINTNEGQNIEIIKKRVIEISSKLGVSISYLQLDFLGVKYVDQKGDQFEYKLTLNELIDIVNSLGKNKVLKLQNLDKIKYSMCSFPYITESLEKNIPLASLRR